MKKENKPILNITSFFGILVFIYIIISAYFNELNPLVSHFFGLFIFALTFSDKNLFNKKNFYVNKAVIFYLFFVIWAILSFFWVRDEESYYDRFQRIIFCAVSVFFFYNIFRWYDLKKYFFWGIVAGGWINFLIFFNILPYNISLFEEDTFRFAGTFGNANSLAIFISFSIFSSILLINFFTDNRNRFLKYFLMLNIPMGIYLIIQTGSRKGFILGISFLFLFFLPYIKTIRGIVFSFLIVIFLFTGFSYLSENEDFSEQLDFLLKRFEGTEEALRGTGQQDSSTDTRMYFTEEAFDIWKNSPLIGIGLNNFAFYYGTYAHNNFVEILANLGFVGFILFYLFYLFSAASILSIKNRQLRISALFFIIIFTFMDYAWVSYYDIPYLTMIVMLTTMKHDGNEEKNENNSDT